MRRTTATVDGFWWHAEDGLPTVSGAHSYFSAGPTSSLASSLVASAGRSATLTAERLPWGLVFAGHSRVRFWPGGTGQEFSTGPTVGLGKAARKARRSRAVRPQFRGQLLVQRASYNYHHCVVEIATSALRWQQEGVLVTGRPLVVAAAPFVTDLLRLAGLAGDIRVLPRNALALLVDVRILQCTPAGFMSPLLIDEVSRRVTASVGVDVDGPGVVYLQRPGGQRRRLANESDVLRTIRMVLGEVTVVDAGSLSVADQVRAVRGARIVIGPHGAQLTNLVWARRAEVLVELLPYPLGDYRALAVARGVEHRPVRGDAYEAPDHEAAFRCDPEAVAEALRGLR